MFGLVVIFVSGKICDSVFIVIMFEVFRYSFIIIFKMYFLFECRLLWENFLNS